MTSPASASTAGIYVHVPFCAVKCTYCHFAIDPGPAAEDRQERYLRAVLAEIDASLGWTKDVERADSVYFGGGTPTLFSPDRLGRVLGALRRRFPLDPRAEVTVEANPRDLDRSGYARLRTLGVSRLSLGVQAVDDAVLRDMGRLHTAEDSRRAVADARDAGFSNVSVDLILGWPGETAERWRRGLDGILAMSPDHVSLYVLEVDGKTLLSHRRRSGTLHLPDDDLVADLYHAAVDRLRSAGILWYEISNFARPGFESRHNGKYWDDAPFVGFGMSAHSYVGGRRWWNHDTYGAYCRSMEGNGSAVAGERTPSHPEQVGEALFTALRRREGIDLAAFRARYGVDPLEDYRTALRDCWEARLLEVREGRLRLTDTGALLSNEVFRAFV
jgi:putative oxygen-independent coproporphyrinogen III oxidase